MTSASAKGIKFVFDLLSYKLQMIIVHWLAAEDKFHDNYDCLFRFDYILSLISVIQQINILTVIPAD